MIILLKDLKPSTQYYIRLRPKFGTGEIGEWSQAFPFTTINDDTVPKAPTNLQVSVSGADFIAKWDAVTENTNSTPIVDLSHYLVRFEDMLNSARYIEFTTQDTTRTLTINENLELLGTNPNFVTQVKVTVWAVDKYDTISAAAFSVAQIYPPDISGLNFTAVNDATYTDGEQNLTAAIDFSWVNEPDYGGVQIRWRKTGSSDAYFYAEVPFDRLTESQVSTYRHTGFPVGVSYDFSMRVRNSAWVWSVWSDVVAEVTAGDTTPPADPTGVTATAGYETILVKWAANSESDIKYYILNYALNNSFTDTPVTVNNDGTIVSVGPLPTETQVFFRVKAVDNSGNQSGWSSTVSATTGQITIPDVDQTDGNPPSSSPTPSATNGIGGIHVSWTKVANADPVTYRVYIGTASNFVPGPSNEIGETTGAYYFAKTQDSAGTPLAYGSNRYFKVLAYDYDGDGPMSASSGPAQSLKIATGDIGFIATDIDPSGTINNAQATANSALNLAGTKNKTFYQNDPPVSGMLEGDMWFDLNDGNKAYRYTGGVWTVVQDTTIQTANANATAALSAATAAQSTADGRNKTYYQSTQPTDSPVGTLKIGDLWFDTDDGYHPWRWSGSGWSDIRDGAIVAGNGSTIFYQASTPTGGTYVDGDTWFDTDDGYKLYVYKNNQWNSSQFGQGALSANSITASHIVSGTITGDKIFSNTITGDKIQANAITSGLIDAGAITAGKLSIGAIGYDPVNGSFETAGATANDAAGWSKNSSGNHASATIARTTTAAQFASGLAAMRIQTAASPGTGVIQSDPFPFSVTTDVPVWARAVARSSSGAPNLTIQFVTYSDAAGTAVVGVTTVYSGGLTSTFAQYGSTAKLLASVNSSAKYARWIVGTLSSATTVYIDSFEGGAAVNGTMIQNGVILGQHIDVNTIKASNIEAKTITFNQIADDTITGTQIAPGAITFSEIADNTITTTKITATGLDTPAIKAGAITSDSLAANAVITSKVLAGAISADKLSIGVSERLKDVWVSYGSDASAWTVVTGSAPVSVTSGLAVSGSQYLSLDAAGTTNIIHSNEKIPFDPNALYKITVRARQQVSDPTKDRFYCGVAGFLFDGTPVNKDGANGFGSQHYFAVAGATLTTDWVEHTGYFKGAAALGSGFPSNDANTPGKVNDQVRFISPIIYANYVNGNGEAWVDMVKLEVVTGMIGGTQISDGAIKTEHIVTGGLSADVITTGYLDVGTLINTSAITAEKISSTSLGTKQLTINSGGYIQSSGYSAGTSGFKIAYDGTAEFQDVIINGALSGTTAIYGADGNLFGPGNFESPKYRQQLTSVLIAGWTLNNTQQRAGQYCLQLSCASAAYANQVLNPTTASRMSVEGGQKYTASAWVKRSSDYAGAGYGVSFFVVWRDSSGTQIGSNDQLGFALQNELTTSYQMFARANVGVGVYWSEYLVAPGNAATAEILVRDEDGTAGYVWIDQIRFERYSLLVGELKAASITGGTITGAGISGGTITGSIIKSNNFISGSTGFQITASGDIEFNDVDKFRVTSDTNKYVEIKKVPGYYPGTNYPAISFRGGVVYAEDAYVGVYASNGIAIRSFKSGSAVSGGYFSSSGITLSNDLGGSLNIDASETTLMGPTSSYIKLNNSGDVILSPTQITDALYIYNLSTTTTNYDFLVRNSATQRVYAYTSTIENKKNVRPLDVTDEQFMNLAPVVFSYKDTPDDSLHYGLIAEQVESIDAYKSAVSYDAEGKVSGLMFPSVYATFIPVIQRLITRVSDLEDRLDTLKQ